MTSAPAPIDHSILDRLEHRMQMLEQRSLVTREEIKHTGRDLLVMHDDVRIELDALRKELASLDVKTRGTIEELKHAIAQFRSAAKQGDFQRIQSRIDAWAPESRITRTQFSRLLEDY